jgi:hypothetical protein
MEEGLRLLMDYQLCPELLQGALGERPGIDLDPQRHFPAQVVGGTVPGFLIRDVVVGLEHERGS